MKRWEWGGLFVVGVCMAALLLKPAALHFETTAFPVVGELEILSVERHEDGVLISGRAVKHRDCSFVGIDWYLGERGGSYVRVPAEFLDPPQIRTPGTLEWSSLYVGLLPRQLSTSFADVIHECRGNGGSRSLSRFYSEG